MRRRLLHILGPACGVLAVLLAVCWVASEFRGDSIRAEWPAVPWEGHVASVDGTLRIVSFHNIAHPAGNRPAVGHVSTLVTDAKHEIDFEVQAHRFGFGASWGTEWSASWGSLVFLVDDIYALMLPYWFLILGCLLPFAWWVRSVMRHQEPGHCPACGYDLRGNPDAAVCPECGAALAEGAAEAVE